MSDKNSQLEKLRRLAESRLQECQKNSLESSPEQLAEQIHELEVHQVELEIQNEELLRSHMELESARDQYAALFDYAPVAYLIINKAGRIERANLISAELFGKHRLQMLEDYLYKFVAKEDRGDLFHHLRCVFNYQTRQTCEVRVLLSDGSGFFSKLDSVVQPGGESDTLQCLTLVSDISELKRSEAANRQAKRIAEDANKAKSHFLAAASHDLRQPLQAMTTITDYLKTKLSTRDDELLGLIDNLSNCLVNMNEMFNTLLNLNQLESGSITPEIKIFTVDELLRRLEVIYRPLVAEKQLKLRVVNCSATIRSDPVLLYQILDNLVSNAVRYTESGKVLVGCRRHGSRLRFEVWDTGIGIPESQRDLIFDHYHQINNPGRDRSKGLGLGLAIAVLSARLLGQRIELKTKESGSMFSIEAPLVTVEKQHKENLSSIDYSNDSTATASLLIVDDDSIILNSLSYLMESYGYKVTGTKSSSEAMTIIREGSGQFDFIISDYRLPDGETGIELINAIRQKTGSLIPALIITGDLEMSETQAFVDTGLKVLHKPVGAEVLNQQIRQMIV